MHLQEPPTFIMPFTSRLYFALEIGDW